MSDENKDKNYNDTNKKDSLAGRETVCGFKAIPGEHFQSGVICTKCTSCKSVATTKVDSTWSVKSYLCCYYCGCYWWCWQTLKGKDYTLKNGTHSCSKCNTVLYDYQAC